MKIRGWILQWPIKRAPKRVVIHAEWVFHDPNRRELPAPPERPQLPPPDDVRHV